MAEAIVDRLEPVEVEHQQAESAVGPPGARDLALDDGEQEGPVVEAGQRVVEREPQGGVARPALFARDDRGEVREEPERQHVDDHDDDLVGRVRQPAACHQQGAEEGGRDGRGQDEAGAAARDQGGRGHDQEVAEDERAADAAREHDQDGQEGDCCGALDQEEGADVRHPRRHVVEDEDDAGGDQEQEVDGRRRVRPEPSGSDDDRRRQQEGVADVPDHGIVGRQADPRARGRPAIRVPRELDGEVDRLPGQRRKLVAREAGRSASPDEADHQEDVADQQGDEDDGDGGSGHEASVPRGRGRCQTT
jgi:hypothetical protein